MDKASPQISPVSLNDVLTIPDIICDRHKETLEKFGYLIANISDLPTVTDTWDAVHKYFTRKPISRQVITRLNDVSLCVNYEDVAEGWGQDKRNIQLEEAFAKLSAMTNGEKSPLKVIYPVIQNLEEGRIFLKDINIDSFESFRTVIQDAVEETEWRAGVQTFYIYCGQYMTVFLLHVEDNRFNSLNINLVGADKCWDIIEPKFTQALWEASKVFQAELSKRLGRSVCSDPLQHKSLFLTDTFFKTNQIPVQRVVHKAGQVIFIGPNVYHQGINLGQNIAIAVNFTSSTWLDEVYEKGLHKVQCKCKEAYYVGKPGKLRKRFKFINAPFTDKELENIASHHRTSKRLLQAISSEAKVVTNVDTAPQQQSDEPVTKKKKVPRGLLQLV